MPKNKYPRKQDRHKRQNPRCICGNKDKKLREGKKIGMCWICN